MEFEQMIPMMAKATIVTGSVVTYMWESQYYSTLADVPMHVIAKC
jgi:hypothetical protein